MSGHDMAMSVTSTTICTRLEKKRRRRKGGGGYLERRDSLGVEENKGVLEEAI